MERHCKQVRTDACNHPRKKAPKFTWLGSTENPSFKQKKTKNFTANVAI